MQLLYAFVENYNMLYELLGLLVILEISAHIPDRIKYLTIWTISLLFAESLMFHLEKWTQTFESLSLLRPLLTAGKYTVYPLILMSVMQMNITKKFSKPVLALIVAPEVISTPVYFTSQWTHIVCWFDENNIYHEGPLSHLPYWVFGFYTVLFIFHNVVFFKNYARINSYLAVYITFVPVLGAVIFQAMKLDVDYISLFTSALMLYYFCTYIHISNLDPLTSLLNRQNYYKDMKADARYITSVVSVDMNELKYLNDNFGHEAGDTALKTVAEILRDGCGKKGTAYRIGGDEFMLFFTNTDEDEIFGIISEMRRRLSETPYSCAFGCAMKKPDDLIHAAVTLADKRMYDDKAAMKKVSLNSDNPVHFRD